MLDDLLTPPRARDLPRGELERRKRHLVAEAHRQDETRRGARRPARGRVVPITLAAALILVVGAAAALGGARVVASWLSSWREPDRPVASAPDVVIATGESGLAWRLVATPTDQGLCTFLLFDDPVDGQAGMGGCGPSDVLGDPWARDPGHWVSGGNGSGGAAALNRRIVWGVTAAAVKSVDLVLFDGSSLPANVVEQPEGIDAPLNVFWAVLPPEVGGVDLTTIEHDVIPVHAIVGRDGSGTVLEERVVDQPHS
jgi:hypothetical protein